jgi:hypothetical protein
MNIHVFIKPFIQVIKFDRNVFLHYIVNNKIKFESY